jgi:hypothetical protein
MPFGATDEVGEREGRSPVAFSLVVFVHAATDTDGNESKKRSMRSGRMR